MDDWSDHTCIGQEPCSQHNDILPHWHYSCWSLQVLLYKRPALLPILVTRRCCCHLPASEMVRVPPLPVIPHLTQHRDIVSRPQSVSICDQSQCQGDGQVNWECGETKVIEKEWVNGCMCKTVIHIAKGRGERWTSRQVLTSPRPSPSSRPNPKIRKSIPIKEKGNWASRMSLKTYGLDHNFTMVWVGVYMVQIEAAVCKYLWVSGRCPKSRQTTRGRTQGSSPCSSRTLSKEVPRPKTKVRNSWACSCRRLIFFWLLFGKKMYIHVCMYFLCLSFPNCCVYGNAFLSNSEYQLHCPGNLYFWSSFFVPVVCNTGKLIPYSPRLQYYVTCSVLFIKYWVVKRTWW